MIIVDNEKNKGLIQFDMEKLVNFLREDTEEEGQVNQLKRLAELRGADVNTYIDNGLFYVGEIDDLYYIMEELGYVSEETYDILDRIEDGEKLDYPEIAEQWGIREQNESLFLDSFIIPLVDAYGNLIKFVSYSNLRGSNLKYINIDLLDKNNSIIYPNIKLYGMQNTKMAFEQGKMFILEGMFDTLRLMEEGLPASNIMGSKLTEYQREYFGRFKKLYYIKDDDKTGEEAFARFKRYFPHTEVIGIPVKNIKDTDEYGKQYKYNNAYGYKEWIEELRKL